MIHNVIRSSIYFLVFVALQVLVLNNIHLFRIATPFLYIYFIIKLPVGTSRMHVILFSFLTGLVIDAFSNTAGMHAAACTLAGFLRDPLINLYMGKNLSTDIFPSFHTFGYGGFFKYAFTFILIHHIALYLIDSLDLFDPLYLILRILTSSALTVLLACAIEAFNLEVIKNDE